MAHPHYAHIRFLGLGGRIQGTNEAPLRLLNGEDLVVKVRGYIMPVLRVEDGFAVVDGSAKPDTALARTPKLASGGWDYEALNVLAPVITDPWSIPVLASLKTVGTKAEASKPKADPKAAKAPVPKATAMKVSGVPTPKATAAVKAAEAPSEAAAISYLAGLSGEGMAELIAKLAAAKQAAPANRTKKSAKAK